MTTDPDSTGTWTAVPVSIHTCVGARCQATLVESVKQQPANRATGASVQNTGDEVVQRQEWNSPAGGQVGQNEAALLHRSLNDTSSVAHKFTRHRCAVFIHPYNYCIINKCHDCNQSHLVIVI